MAIAQIAAQEPWQMDLTNDGEIPLVGAIGDFDGR